MNYSASFSVVLILFSTFVWAQPISLNPKNPHYFEYKGKPRVLITSAEHYGAVLNLDFEYRTYLKTLKEEGMDYTRIFTGSYVENNESFGIENNTLAPLENRLIAPWARSEVPGYVNGGNKFDLEKWDADYFERLHDFVSTAESFGIIVEVTFFSSIYRDDYWEYCPFYAENNINETDRIERILVHTMKNGNLLKYQEALVRKIATELNKYDNVIYEIQNEPWSDQEGKLLLLNRTVIPKEGQKWYTRSNQASVLSLEWQAKMVAIVKEVEAGLHKKHLVAQNYCNYAQPIGKVDREIDIMNFHYAWPEAVQWNYGFNRPISFDESGFSQKKEESYRMQAWRFILAGGAVFNNLDYSFVAGHEDGSFEQNSSPGLGTSLLRRQFRFLKDFMTDIDFVNMKPSNHLVVHAAGFIYQGLADEGNTYAYYFEGNGRISVSLKTGKGKYRVEWWDPENGSQLSATLIKSESDVLEIKGPEVSADVVLKVYK